MNRAEALAMIKENILCTEYLERSSRAGRNMYCCPYCGSGTGPHGTGAVKYYPNTNTWHCHACHKGGDVLDAYQATTGTDFNTALYDLGTFIGIEIDQGPAPKGTAAAMPADYTEYYMRCTERLEDPEAVSYLLGRGISLATAKEYQLGYDPEADPATAPGDIENSFKAHPAPRIIVPCSLNHYIARSTDPEILPQFKVMNPSQERGGGRVSIFNWSALYSEADTVFITEGVFDALSFLEAGAVALALNSKANGKLLIEQLRKKPTKAALVIVPDNDENPRTAEDTMRRAQELNNELKRLNLNSIIYNVAGTHHDANDALTADPEAFKKSINAAAQALHRDDLDDFLEKIQTDAYKPSRTGLQFFDNLLGGGIVQQSLLLLMAAPAAGKTTMCVQVAEVMAEHGKPVLYLNFEMSREQMLAKAISAKAYRLGETMTMLQILQGYQWTERQQKVIDRVISKYRKENHPFIKYNPAGYSSELSELLSFLTATGEAAKAAGTQAPAVIVDYLHLIKSRDRLETAELIKQAVTGLKQYAVNYNTFVIGVIASNRMSNKDGRLTMESGRDSSNLEYTGDYILSLNYAAIDSGKVKPDDTTAVAELQQATRREMIIRVLKNRFATQGRSAQVLFDAAHNMFYGQADLYQEDGWKLDNGSTAFKADTGNARVRY